MTDLKPIREKLINGMGKLPAEGGNIYVQGETYPCKFIRACHK